MLEDVPANAPESCPGASSVNAGRSNGCDGCPNQRVCASGTAPQVNEDIKEKIKHRISSAKRVIIVMSGKGGVGKSSVTAILAWALSDISRGCKVGVLDVDIVGPSIPLMMGCDGEAVHKSGDGWSPVFVDENLEVMSVGMLLADPDQAIIWRGPKKNKLIENMLSDVDWSDLDYLLIDTPPGTTDEHISLVQLLLAAGALDKTRALIVTTNQEVALSDVRKQIGFCGKVNLKVIGVVGNMHSHSCSQCGHNMEVFPSINGGAEKLCQDYSLPLLSQLPIDSRLTRCLDSGINIMTTDEEDCISEETLVEIDVMVGHVLKAFK